MKITVCRWTALFILILLPFQALSEEPPATQSQKKSYFDLGLKAGTFLPSRILGVTEVLPLWGIKMGHMMTDSLALEYDFDMASAKGVTYYLGYLSLRYDFQLGKVLPLFFLFGFDVHHYKRKNTKILQREFPFKTTTGWHAGFGSETHLFGDLMGRMDLRMGFSPGRQLSILFSGIIRF